MGMKLDYKRTFLLGFGFLGVSVLWLLYNTYVPIFLQAGNPEFEVSGATTIGFGLSAVMAGLIMTLDNIAAFFIQPFIGIVSDRTRTRIGRRKPYILVGAPIAAVAFVLIPVAVNQIPPELSGQTSQLGGPLTFFMIAVGVMLLAMAIFRTPIIALMPDITPSPLRSKAHGVINMMGGIGGLLATFGGALLYRIDKLLAFGVGSLILLLAVAVVLVYIKERLPEASAAVEKKEQWWDTLRQAGAIPREARKSLILIQKSGVVTAMVGMLQAIPGTILHDRLTAEGRIAHQATGDNADGTTNIIPRMGIERLQAGYRRLMAEIYSPHRFYERVKTCLELYKPSNAPVHLQFDEIYAFLRSIWKLGIIGEERREYWKLFFWTLFRHPRKLALAITFTIYGFHFRQVNALNGIS